jgi:glycerate kinase
LDDQSLHGKVVSALAAGARSRSRSAGDIGREHIPVMVLAGQVTLDGSALRDAGVAGGVFDLRPRRIGAASHRRRGQSARRVGAGHGSRTRE